MTVCAELQRRFLLIANRFAVRTARMKTTTRRRMDRAWDVTLQNRSFFLAANIGNGNRGEQSPRVRMLGVPVDGFALGDLDDLAEVHDRYSMADVLDHP